MRRNKKVVVAVWLVFVVQIAISYGWSRLFVRHMSENTDMAERHMIESGVPRNQVDAVTSAMSTVSFSVWRHFDSLLFVLLFMNSMLLLFLYNERRNEASSDPDKH